MARLRKYSVVYRLFHWTNALLIFGLIWLGWFIVNIDYYDPNYQSLLSYHRSLGIVVFIILVCQLLLRWPMSKPPPEKFMKPWERLLAKTTHITLFVLTLLIPVSGYLISASNGASVPFFNLFDIPSIVSLTHETLSQKHKDFLFDTHKYLGYLIGVIGVMHGIAALKRHFINHDNTLRKMI